MEDFWTPLQEIIKGECSTFDKTWQVRKRVIDTYFLVTFIFKIVLSKNQQVYKSLLTEMWKREELRQYQTEPISASSLCEARSKLPEDIFIKLKKFLLIHYDNLISTQIKVIPFGGQYAMNLGVHIEGLSNVKEEIS